MAQQLDLLRKAYLFDSWPEPSPESEQLLVWRFRLFGNELEAWAAARIQHMAAERTFGATTSVWQPAREPDGSLMAVDVLETASRAAAREELLRALGEFQGPQLKRVDQLGEVAFAAGDAARLFARANLLVVARSVERVSVAVADAAARLDRHLARRPEVETAGGPRIRAFEAAAPGPLYAGRSVKLRVEATGRGEEHTWFKLFTSTGSLSLESDGPVYVPRDAGRHQIELYAIDPLGNATREVRELS